MKPGGIDEEFMKEIQNDFYDDISEKLALINQKMLLIEKNGYDLPIIREIYRTLHNIKGTSATLGIMEISVIAHKSEDFLTLLLDKSIDISEKNMSEFFSMIDTMEKLKLLYKKGASKDELQHFFQNRIQDFNKKTKQILVVENSKSIRKYIKKGLAQEGFQVNEAQDSVGALIRAVTEPIDFIITSKEQAIIDGVNLIRMIKANDLKKDLKAILITSEAVEYANIDKIIFKDKDLMENIINYIRNDR